MRQYLHEHGLINRTRQIFYARWVAYLLPTTHALDLMRVAALGTRPLLPLPIEWLMLVVTSAGILVVGRWAWLRTEHRLRVLGTLGQH